MRLSPRAAQYFLDHCNHLPEQQAAHPARVLAWLARIQDGTFSPSPAITFREDGMRLTLTNGQTRLRAIALGDQTVDVAVVVEPGDGAFHPAEAGR